MYTVKKLNGEDLVKIIEGFRYVIMNINFSLIHFFIYLLIFIMINLNPSIISIIYYDKLILIIQFITALKLDPNWRSRSRVLLLKR
jgi:hypothetical protein